MEIFDTSFNVYLFVCLFVEHSLVSIAHSSGNLADSPQARANVGMCAVTQDESLSEHLPTHDDFWRA